MVLSSSQQIVLAVSLALCLCFLVPRMIVGGGHMADKQPRTMRHPLNDRQHKESSGKSHAHHGEKSFSNQIKSAMDQELKSEKAGSGRSMTFALMPIYAVGVALFAAYKFTKIKSKENGKSKSFLQDNKSKETETQLLELEQHLMKTERMLNSLLMQLDPLSNCVNTLAAEQKNEIMSQLQSIRQLMKTSGINKSALHNPANEACDDRLEDLIHSFDNRQYNIQEVDNESEEPLEEMDDLAAKHSDPTEYDDADITENHVSDGLRKRNIKD